eukprot:474791-Pyramimonas_sp.AAC.1
MRFRGFVQSPARGAQLDTYLERNSALGGAGAPRIAIGRHSAIAYDAGRGTLRLNARGSQNRPQSAQQHA